MNITFFVTSPEGGGGGAEQMILRLAGHAANVGHAVDLLNQR